MENEQYVEYLEKTAKQRAALMGVVVSILAESERSGEEIRKFILNTKFRD